MVLLELLFVDDAVDGPYYAGAFHFVDGADEEYEYSYDENGNMTKDLNRGIEEIRYNFLNLPSKITFTEKNSPINNEFMNIFKSIRIYATQSGKLYNSLKLWSESVSRDLNESSMTCYPNGFTGFSFGDRLNAVIYITLAYLHRKIFYEECPENKILPMPETDYNYWKRIIESSIEAQHLSSSKNPKYNELLSDLFGAVYDYCDWQSFISSTIGYFEDDDDETVKAFSFMFSKYHTYTDDFNYQVRDLSKEEIDFLNHSTFYKFGLFDFILPQSVENDFEDIPFIDRLYRRLYVPVWDKNSKYKHGDIVSVDENSQVIYSKSDACLILI